MAKRLGSEDFAFTIKLSLTRKDQELPEEYFEQRKNSVFNTKSKSGGGSR